MQVLRTERYGKVVKAYYLFIILPDNKEIALQF